jgi:hypothetical protein
MRTLTFTFDCSLPPTRVLEAAHVTEGTGTGIGTNWERCHYDWSTPGCVTATVTDSNVYAAPSSWTITAIAASQGSSVEMTWARQFKHGIRGSLFGTAFRLIGRPMFRKYARQIINNLDALQGERI